MKKWKYSHILIHGFSPKIIDPKQIAKQANTAARLQEGMKELNGKKCIQISYNVL